MQVKVVPEPPDSLADVATVRDALPRVPRSESDCCARLVDRVAWIEDREAAREWLVFLGAVGLARRTGGGYVRSDSSGAGESGTEPDRVDREQFVAALRDAVFGAGTVLDALDSNEPHDAADVFEVLEPELPTWERRRRPDAGGVWRDRVQRLLEWWVLLGDADGTSGGYVRVGGGSVREDGRSVREDG